MAVETSGSLGRGVDVLLAMAQGSRPAVGSVIAERLGRHRVQVVRTLQSLVAAGMVTRDPVSLAYDLDWRVRSQAVRLVRARLMAEGPGVLREASEATGTATFLAEVRGDGAVAFAEHVPTGLSWAGRSYPLYCDDAGQALLWDCSRDELDIVFADTEFIAYGPNSPRDVSQFAERLATARERGYSVADEESEPAVFAVAAPVRDFTGEVVCALHTEGLSRDLAHQATEHGQVITELAGRLSSVLGYVADSAQGLSDDSRLPRDSGRRRESSDRP
ncbi:IclR family transcriptional regulator [Streptomyces sp. NPDC057757]|uniref:IclR family transcriptional regulator n=1 Tax=Streptomyces sp. NPDC057757 TaxID=3346241 RepID=UPI0036B6B6AC